MAMAEKFIYKRYHDKNTENGTSVHKSASKLDGFFLLVQEVVTPEPFLEDLKDYIEKHKP